MSKDLMATQQDINKYFAVYVHMHTGHPVLRMHQCQMNLKRQCNDSSILKESRLT